ncbi:hypothetical protein ACQ4PT_031529 [Festuca glaucescens]
MVPPSRPVGVESTLATKQLGNIYRAKRKAAKLRKFEEGEQKKAKQMAEAPSKIESARKWVVDHKLRAVGCLWLTGISSSIAYNWSRPHMKTSVKLIHARFAHFSYDRSPISLMHLS